MTKVSRRILSQALQKHIFELFVKIIVDLNSPDDVEIFLEDLLSPTERIMLVKRLAIAILLTKGYTYDDIDETLKVSRPTIMNVSFWLKNGKSGYKKAIDRILKTQKREEFFDKIEEILLQLSPPKRYGSAAYERKQQIGKDLVSRRLKRGIL